MPIDLTTFKKKLERDLDVPINETETLRIRWSPSNLDETVWNQMMKSSTEAAEAKKAGRPADINPFDLARNVVAPLMVDWELEDEGKPFPITPENIAGFGLEFVMATANAIQEDFKIGKAVKKASGDGSSTPT